MDFLVASGYKLKELNQYLSNPQDIKYYIVLNSIGLGSFICADIQLFI